MLCHAGSNTQVGVAASGQDTRSGREGDATVAVWQRCALTAENGAQEASHDGFANDMGNIPSTTLRRNNGDVGTAWASGGSHHGRCLPKFFRCSPHAKRRARQTGTSKKTCKPQATLRQRITARSSWTISGNMQIHAIKLAGGLFFENRGGHARPLS